MDYWMKAVSYWTQNYRQNPETGEAEVEIEFVWDSYKVEHMGLKFWEQVTEAAEGLTDVKLGLKCEPDYDTDHDTDFWLNGWRKASADELEVIQKLEDDKAYHKGHELLRMAMTLQENGWDVDIPEEYQRKRRAITLTS